MTRLTAPREAGVFPGLLARWRTLRGVCGVGTILLGVCGEGTILGRRWRLEILVTCLPAGIYHHWLPFVPKRVIELHFT